MTTGHDLHSFPVPSPNLTPPGSTRLAQAGPARDDTDETDMLANLLNERRARSTMRHTAVTR